MAGKNYSTKKTGILREEIFIRHDTGDYHPESPQRLVKLYNMLDDWRDSAELEVVPARKATEEELLRIHSPYHLKVVAGTAGKRMSHLDGDTPTSADSYEAALYAAGGAIELTDRVLDGKLKNAFGLVRPPGHHAEKDRAMGFCLFNNIAIAAAHVRDIRKLDRILIVDWDLHHGNGTQHSFYEDNRVLYMSTHQYPYYPGSGHYREVGSGAGEGYTINVPLPGGQGNAEYIAIFEEVLKPIALEYKPQLVLVSAGFDTFERDPLGQMRITTDGYIMLAKILGNIANECCDGKIVYLLEGGYNIPGLVESVKGVILYLMGKISDSAIGDWGMDTIEIQEYIRELSSTFGRYWKSLKR